MVYPPEDGHPSSCASSELEDAVRQTDGQTDLGGAQLSLPLADAVLERLLVGTERHALRHHDVVVEQLRHLVRDLDDERSTGLVRHHVETDRRPLRRHLVQRLQQ